MNAEERIGAYPGERAWALTFLGAATVLRLPCLLHYRFDSDESQHLHVVWGWTKGLLPYRDVFDNHSPLFHVLMAPLLVLVGERPDALTLMRFGMVPLALLAIALTYAIAANLYGRRVAMWSAVLLGLHYEFFYKSVEFRTDNLWTVGWLATLGVITSGPITAWRALAAGAALGATLCVSQKTFLMVLALAFAAGLAVVLSGHPVRAARWRRAPRLACAAAAGFAAAPLAFAVFFAAHGALGAFVYGVFTHNTLAGLGTWHEGWRPAILAVGLTLTAWVAFPRVRAAGGDRVGTLRVFLVVATAVYALALESIWPLVTSQDSLPLFPLMAVMIVRALELWARPRRHPGPTGAAARLAPAATLLLLLFAESVVIVLKGPIWRDRTSAQTALVAEVLDLTDRGEPVLDTKGETILRRRAFPWVLETITIERLRRGLIADTIAEDVVRTGCFVATVDSARFPARGRAFLNENFVPVGVLRVAGQFLHPSGGPSPRAEFDVAIPGPYVVVTPTGSAAGTLDGTQWSGARDLRAGHHQFVAEREPDRLAVVWARAVERGYSPFGPLRSDS